MIDLTGLPPCHGGRSFPWSLGNLLGQLRVPVCLLLPAALLTGGCGESATDPDPGELIPPTPIIDLIIPSFQSVGDPSAQVTVEGREFRPESAIHWNGQQLPTVSQVIDRGWGGSITASVPVSELDEPKDVIVTVRTPRPSGGFLGAISASTTYSVQYPWPQCQETDPWFAEVGAPTTTFLCNGWGFLPVTEVYLDEERVESANLDYRNVQFTASEALLSEEGIRRVRVRNPDKQSHSGWLEGLPLPVLRPVEVGSGGRQIGAGCIIDAHQVLQCWDSIPRPVAEHLRFVELEGNCAVGTDAQVYCWGYNAFGRFGTGSLGEQTTAPDRPVAGGLDLHSVADGGSHVCALDRDGAAWCWGSNLQGALGTDGEVETCYMDEPCALRPVPVAGGLRFVALAASWRHTCGIEVGGIAYCWGSDEWGDLGNGPGRDDSAVPRSVESEERFVSIGVGYLGTCALTADGEAFCWGGRGYGEPLWDVPTPVAAGQRFRTHTGRCGITADEQIHCLGESPDWWAGWVSDHRWTEIHDHSTVEILPTICGITTERAFLCWGYVGHGVPFPMVHRPAVCLYHGHNPDIPCYPSPTPVLGVKGLASWPEN